MIVWKHKYERTSDTVVLEQPDLTPHVIPVCFGPGSCCGRPASDLHHIRRTLFLMHSGSMSHPIIEISELTQLVANRLLLDSPKSLVSLACTRRALEEQALSTLWSEQPSLVTLFTSALPSGTLSPFRLPPAGV